jgi:hypothetical protein
MRTHLLTRLLALSWMLCTASCAGDVTHIREEEFRLSLPGRWTGGYDAQYSAWIYLTPSGEEGIEVRTLQRGPDPDGSKLQSDLESLLNHRRNMEQRFSDEPLTLTAPAMSRAGGQLTAIYDAIGAASQRRKRTLLVVNRVVAGSFCYEAFGLSKEEFSARADIVLRQARLAQ